MNVVRRKKINKTISHIEEIKTILTSILYEEQNAFDNTPESVQDGYRGDKMQAAISQIEDAIDNMDDAIEALMEASL